MATKKQRMAQRTSGGEPLLSLSSFSATIPADASPASAGWCASVPECYLVYCYLCRTGLWREITPRLSSCGALYFACEPEIHPVGGQQRRAAPAAAPLAAAAEGAAAPAPAFEDVEMAEKEDDDEVSSSSGGDDDDEAAGVTTAADGAGAPGDAAAPHAGTPAAAGASTPAAPAAAAPAGLLSPAEPAEPEGQTFRERTMMVPLSIANVAPTPDRLHELLRLTDVEDGAPVSLALVDSDGTVIVAYLHPDLVPPEVLHGAESGDDEEEDAGMLATVLPDDEAGAGAGS